MVTKAMMTVTLYLLHKGGGKFASIFTIHSYELYIYQSQRNPFQTVLTSLLTSQVLS